eukprot:5973046-Lingulodinium_polyedra.AAC.1
MPGCQAPPPPRAPCSGCTCIGTRTARPMHPRDERAAAVLRALAEALLPRPRTPMATFPRPTKQVRIDEPRARGLQVDRVLEHHTHFVDRCLGPSARVHARFALVLVHDPEAPVQPQPRFTQLTHVRQAARCEVQDRHQQRLVVKEPVPTGALRAPLLAVLRDLPVEAVVLEPREGRQGRAEPGHVHRVVAAAAPEARAVADGHARPATTRGAPLLQPKWLQI